MNFNAHIADYFTGKPEKAYAFLNPYVQCRYGRIGVRLSEVEGRPVAVKYVLTSLVYSPYPDGGSWETERDCTEDEVEYIGIIYSLYEVSEVDIDVPSMFKHLKLGSRKRAVAQVLLAA